MKIYTTFDHTADIGILVQGSDLKTLFHNCAWAMFDQMTTPPKTPPKTGKKTITLEVRSQDIQELLVRWLSELLALSELLDIVFTEFKISHLASDHLKASVSGFPRKNFKYKTEIKAVTYHELTISQQNKKYTAQVIFDV